ncbi:hypothetical protein CBL_09142 [Carabus blaptoides fortunei]
MKTIILIGVTISNAQSSWQNNWAVAVPPHFQKTVAYAKNVCQIILGEPDDHRYHGNRGGSRRSPSAQFVTIHSHLPLQPLSALLLTADTDWSLAQYRSTV